MDMETGNHSSETASLTEAQAIERLDALDAQTDSTEDNSAALETETLTTEEPADEHSEVEEVEAEGEQSEDDAEEPAGGPKLDDQMMIEFEGEKVSLWDLKRSFKRQAALTQKEQAVANERRSLDDHKQQYVAAVNQELHNRADTYVRIAQSLALPMPDPAMAEDNPGAYIAAKALWEQQQAGINALLTERDQLAKAGQQREAAAIQQAKDAGYHQLLEMHPELKSNEALDQLWSYGRKSFSQEEMNSVVDPRMFSVLHKAAQWDRHMAQAAKVKTVAANKPALSKPGAPNSIASPQSEAIRKAKAKLEKTGSDEAAIAYLDALSKRK